MSIESEKLSRTSVARGVARAIILFHVLSLNGQSHLSSCAAHSHIGNRIGCEWYGKVEVENK